MLKQVFRGKSIRAEHGREADMPVFGKFASVVETDNVNTYPHPENPGPGQWRWNGVCGTSGGGYDSEQEAFEAGLAHAKSQNFSDDLPNERLKAINDARLRHNSHCQTSENYLAEYGPEA